MARINTNIASMIAQASLSRSYQDLNIRLERLSTGLRINRGADDPAGLITSERLRSEMSAIGKAVSNSERAASVIATTEGALSEVSELLNSIKGLIIEASNTGGISPEELEANQLQIDSAIDAITRISNTASFAGLQLLNGTLDYLTSGVPTSAIANTKILGASFGTASNVPVNVQVLGSALTAEITLTADYPGTTNDGTLLSSITLEIAGKDGVTVIQFTSGTSISDVVSAINSRRDTTGVEASLVSAGDLSSGMVFTSIEYGSNAFVSVKKLGSGGEFFDSRISAQRETGQDVTAIVNGVLATGKGLEIAVKSPALNIEMLLTADYAQDTTNVKTFYITGGGAKFQLGPAVNVNQQINFGVRSVAASRLGATYISDELQFLNSIQSSGNNSLNSGNFLNASKIIDSAIDEVAVLRGQLGAIERNTIQPNIRSLNVALENITAAESKIRDADFALETSQLTRAQILVQAGTAVLATANSNAQSVLQLLG